MKQSHNHLVVQSRHVKDVQELDSQSHRRGACKQVVIRVDQKLERLRRRVCWSNHGCPRLVCNVGLVTALQRVCGQRCACIGVLRERKDRLRVGQSINDLIGCWNRKCCRVYDGSEAWANKVDLFYCRRSEWT
jgi:hypothetical protein